MITVGKLHVVPYSAFLASRANDSRASRGEDISVTVGNKSVLFV